MVRLLPSLQTLAVLHPLRPMSRTIFFVKKFRFDAIRIALHGQRPILQMRQQHGRDPDVIIDHLALGEADLRIKDLVEIRNRKAFFLRRSVGLSCMAFRITSRSTRFSQRTQRCRQSYRCPCTAVRDAHFVLTDSSGKESLRRKHRLRLADARDAMFPGFMAAQDFDLHPQKINRHFSSLPSRGIRTASFSVVTIMSRSRRMQRLMKLCSSASL